MCKLCCKRDTYVESWKRGTPSNSLSPGNQISDLRRGSHGLSHGSSYVDRRIIMCARRRWFWGARLVCGPAGRGRFGWAHGGTGIVRVRLEVGFYGLERLHIRLSDPVDLGDGSVNGIVVILMLTIGVPRLTWV